MKIIKRKEAKNLGLLYYFTGKLCKQGHIDKRPVSSGTCYTCAKNSVKKDSKAKQRNKEWVKNNPEKMKEIRNNWLSKNKEVKNTLTAKRRTSKLNRTPIWVDSEEMFLIEEAYRLAKDREKIHGFKWHVDHIIPLQGKNVSGLHTIKNLQVLPAKLNLEKGNKFNMGDLL